MVQAMKTKGEISLSFCDGANGFGIYLLKVYRFISTKMGFIIVVIYQGIKISVILIVSVPCFHLICSSIRYLLLTATMSLMLTSLFKGQYTASLSMVKD